MQRTAVPSPRPFTTLRFLVGYKLLEGQHLVHPLGGSTPRAVYSQCIAQPIVQDIIYGNTVRPWGKSTSDLDGRAVRQRIPRGYCWIEPRLASLTADS